MPFTVIDALSLPSGVVDEDRFGWRGNHAWMLDGATDISSEPLCGTASDASWIAAEVDQLLSGPLLDTIEDLGELPGRVAEIMVQRFQRAQRRPPQDRYEHPSASGIVIRRTGRTLEFVSVGDCSLVLVQRGESVRLGADLRDAGDKRIAASVAAFHAANDGASAEHARRQVWPAIRAARNRLNTPGGYGVLSITAPPPELVRTGRADLDANAVILLATDGLMRLADVFGALSVEEMVTEARRTGLATLGRELRRIEAADASNVRYPRAKTSDDASGLMLGLI